MYGREGRGDYIVRDNGIIYRYGREGGSYRFGDNGACSGENICQGFT